MSEPNPFSLQDADLSSLFRPAWTKPGEQQHSFRSTPEREEKNEKRGSGMNGYERRHPAGKMKPRKHFEPSFSKPRELPPVISGWKIQLIPEARGIDEMAKQIRKEMKAYSLFQLARLLLEKPQRYHLKWSQQAGEAKHRPYSKLADAREVQGVSGAQTRSVQGVLEDASTGATQQFPAAVEFSMRSKVTPLFQCVLDETLWLSEKEVLAHAFSHYRDRYYRLERITTEPPKGSYSSIGVCGMSQTLLGPPNYHEYQNKMRRLHAERFPQIPFEVFKSRIQMSRDEALLERWKEEQSTQEVFYLLSPAAEEGEGKIGSLAEAEEHFEKNYFSSVMKKVERETILSNPMAWQQSSPVVRRMVEDEVESLKRFPLPFSQEVGQALAARGLQLFKAHENIVYASIARPRSFHQQEMSVSDSVKSLLEILKAHAAAPRAEQWKALLASRSPDQDAATHEATLIKDLSWLLHEGYVVNYATRGFQV